MYYTLYTIRTKFIGKRRKCYLMVEKFEFSSESESESGRKVCKYIVCIWNGWMLDCLGIGYPAAVGVRVRVGVGVVM